MNPQGTTLAAKPDAEGVVDAYVDALLALPVAGAAPVPPEAAQDTAADLDVPPDAAVSEASAAVPDIQAAGDGVTMDVDVTTSVQGLGPEDPADVREPAAECAAVEECAASEAVYPPASEEADAVGAPAMEPVAAASVAAPVAAPVAARPAQPVFAVDETAEDIAPAPAPVGQRWLRVAVGDDRYAVELLRVQEVVRLAPLIAVRGAVPSLLGVMNLRGRVVPVHDLGRWLRRAPVVVDERSRIVVLEFQDDLVGLLVTAVTDVVTLDGPQIEPPARGLRDRIGMGIARTPGAPPTVLLDARVVFD